MNPLSRRQALLGSALGVGGVALAAQRAFAAQGAPAGRGWEASYSGGSPDVKPEPPGQPGKDYTPVVTPNGVALPFKVVDGVKVFHLWRKRSTTSSFPGSAPSAGVTTVAAMVRPSRRSRAIASAST